jgi:hypothetical protein
LKPPVVKLHPVDNYMKFVRETMPKRAEDRDFDNWFTRAHHIGSLTAHPMSIQDHLVEIESVRTTASEKERRENDVSML